MSIGARFPKQDGVAKADGSGIYADDIALPRMLHAKILRSPHAHARIRGIDLSAAEALPGVVATLVGAELPLKYGVIPWTQDETALAVEKVRHVGDAVACIAAVDERRADEALALIQVDYEVLPAVLTPEDALEHPEIKVNEKAKVGNITKHVHLQFGEVDEAVASAAAVARETYRYAGSTHVPIEPHCAVARVDADGNLTVWSSTQIPHYVHRELSRVLGLPQSKVRVIQPLLGGAFGGKSDPFALEFCVAKLAMKTGRPVKILYTREEVFYAHRGRHPMKMDVTLALDADAEKLGIDPMEVRRRNFIGEFVETVNGQKITSNGFLKCLELVEKASAWKERHGKLGRGRGLGVAGSMYISGTAYPVYPNEMPQSGVLVKLDRSGRVAIFSGASDIGQGVNTLLCQIAAEELHCDPYDVTVVAADTDLTPVDLGAYSSRVTFMVGIAAREACQKLAEKLRAAGGATFAEACQRAEAAEGAPLAAVGGYRTQKLGGDYRGGTIGASPAYSFTAHVAEVSVDEETGIWKVERIWAAHDCGKALNPTLGEGQIEGSVYMGAAEAQMEEMVYDEKGLLFGPSLLDYRIPTSLDTPDLDSYIVESNDPGGPYGAKEAGEGPLHPAIPAIANAIHDACGIRIRELPFYPQRVLKLLRERDARREERAAS